MGVQCAYNVSVGWKFLQSKNCAGRKKNWLNLGRWRFHSLFSKDLLSKDLNPLAFQSCQVRVKLNWVTALDF